MPIAHSIRPGSEARVTKSSTLEADVSSAIREIVVALGGYAIKNNPSPIGPYKGFPDLTLVMPHGVTAYVEVKRQGKNPTQIQEWWHRELRKLGHRVFVIRSVSQFKQEVLR